jgi:AraC-like DNA-binding protein
VRVERLSFGTKAHEPRRTNYFNIWLARTGAGRFWADAACHPFAAPSLLFFVPYQHIRFEAAAAVEMDRIEFHANFLCVETFHAETGCSGVLFNDLYGSPVVSVDATESGDARELMDRIQSEQRDRPLAYDEATLAWIKLLLIQATRVKSAAEPACRPGGDPRHPVIAQLRELLEQNFLRIHAPSAYAEMLHMSAKSLGRIVREQLGTTLTDLVRQRVLTHAKWQLLHTLRPVKEIAREAGFRDELYFSRMFKKSTGCSPTYFREFETAIRGGSNLSMGLGHAPIQAAPTTSDNSGVAG